MLFDRFIFNIRRQKKCIQMYQLYLREVKYFLVQLSIINKIIIKICIKIREYFGYEDWEGFLNYKK